MSTFELSLRNAIMQYAWVVSDLWRHHAYVHCLSAHCLPQTLRWNTEQRSDLLYLVAGNTESLEKNGFHDIICNQWFWLARSTFHPGDNSNAGECPDPSSFPRRVWFRDYFCIILCMSNYCFLLMHLTLAQACPTRSRIRLNTYLPRLMFTLITLQPFYPLDIPVMLP